MQIKSEQVGRVSMAVASILENVVAAQQPERKK